jgi:membrane fusion protein (multidrug efflux system)
VGDQLVDVVNDSVMLIDYELPARWLSKLQVGQDIELSTEADPDRIYKGRVTAINPLVSSNTRSIQVRGQIPNPDFSLMSGLFANTVQTVGSFKNVLVVPQAALVYGTNGAQIFAVQDSKAVPIAVEVGQKIGTQAIITAARPAAASDSKSSTPTIELKPGLEIIVTGAAKIRPGTTVRTSPYLPADVSVTTGLPKATSGS